MHYASICAIIKDEDKDVREWLNYHFMTGFEHVLIFDNNSRTPLKRTLSDFISNGLVTVEEFPLVHAQQLSAYMSALKYWGNNTKWLAFIDVDEFVVPLEKDDIRDFLDDYNQYAGVGANWAMFSSNGHLERPSGGILENYTACLGLDPHIKRIVQPAMTKVAKSAHHFTYCAGKFCANEDGIPIPGFCTYPIADKIRINHYYYKSRNDFQEKIGRGLGTQMKSGRKRSIGDFDSHLGKPVYEDRAILRFGQMRHGWSDMSANEIKAMLGDCAGMNIENEIARIESSLDAGDLEDACHRAKVLSRYNDWLDLDKLAPRINSLPFEDSKLLTAIKTRLAQNGLSKDDLFDCYQSLATYHEINGDKNRADRIRSWLEKPLSLQIPHIGENAC